MHPRLRGIWRSSFLLWGHAVACVLFFFGAAAHGVEFEVHAVGGIDSNLFRADLGDGVSESTAFAEVSGRLAAEPIEALRLQYLADAFLTPTHPTENNLRQTIRLAVIGSKNLRLETAMTFIAGPREAVRFIQGRNSWATVQARERRQQWQNRTFFHYRFDYESYFIRPAASLIFFDLNSRVRTGVLGYDNWIDRYDLQAGFDVGRAFHGGDEVYLGWRFGRQFQDDDGGRPSTRSNHFDRFFAGVRFSWSEVIQGVVEVGPSMHRYDQPGSVGKPGIDSWYLQAQLHGSNRYMDSWRLEARLERSVASSGLLSSEVRSFSFQYGRKLADRSRLEITTGARALVYDGVAISDWVFHGTAQWTYRLADNQSFLFRWKLEEGRDRAPPRNPGREFSRTIVEAAWKGGF